MPTPTPKDIVETSPFETIDKHALSTPESVTSSIKELATYLTQPATSDLEKVRAFYRWICQNISYDTEAFFTGQYPDSTSSNVLSSRRAICQGYSGLFEELARSAGLSVVSISGWAKGYGYEPGNLVGGDTNHSWNAVKIESGWYLLDCTWGAGYIGEERNFVPEFSEHYFCTPPEQFIYDHLPQDPQWQLLDRTVSSAEFAELPFTRPAFFNYSLELGSDFGSTIKAAGEIDVTIIAPEDVLMLATVYLSGNQIDDSLTLVQREREKYHVAAIFPDVGEYILRIFARRTGEAGKKYKDVLEYKIESFQASTSSGFPITFEAFTEKGCYLYSPLEGSLQVGTSQSFKLLVPNAEKVAVVVGDAWQQLEKRGEVFEGEVSVISGELKVYAKFPDSELYECLLAYSLSAN